jgi:hypothetical protein
VLNLQLHDVTGPNSRVEDHYVMVDFVGWRYFELVEPESARWNDFDWPYYEWFAVYGEPMDITHTTCLNLYLNNLQPGAQSACRVSPVKALPLREAILGDLRMTVGAKTIEIPVELKSGSYLECDANGHGTVFDANGHPLREFASPAPLPTLAAQSNRVSFSCRANAGLNPRAEVTVISAGEPITI